MASRISTAVKTTRKLTNKSTGLDIAVPDFAITQNQGKAEHFKVPKVTYHVVVVSKIKQENESLSGDTLKEDTQEDVVHYTLNLEYASFVRLQNDLDKKYSGTYVPSIYKNKKLESKLGISSKSFYRECRDKQVSVDKFMKWCASTPKIASCKILQSFIGLDKSKLEESSKEKFPSSTSQKSVYKEKKKVNTSDLFEELDFTGGKNTDIFEDESQDISTFSGEQADSSSDLFSEAMNKNARAGLFEREDLMGNVSLNENKFIVLEEKDDDGNVGETSLQFVEEELAVSGEDGLVEVQEDVTSLVAQLKTVTKSSKPIKPPKPVIPAKPASIQAKAIAVETMEDADLAKYVAESSLDSDEVDLGF